MPEQTNTKPRSRCRTAVGTVSRTKQAHADQCDINAIMRRHLAGGGVTHLETREAFYGDVSTIGDYQDSVNRVKAAEARFAGLPSAVRKHFRNEPRELVECALDPTRREEMVELGLLPEIPLTPPPSEAETPPVEAEKESG